MLLSFPIIFFCQDHVQFLSFIVGVLSNLDHPYFFSILFNWSVVIIDPYHSLYISFLPECLHVLLVHCNPFLMSFNLQGSSNVPCSSCLTECFQLCSSSLFSFFHFAQPLKVHGFTRLSKKQLSLPLIFLFLFPPVPS